MTEKSEKKTGRNVSFIRARAAKNDEFYTRRESIEEELWHYASHFRGKVVYCNCDDPKVSQFWEYFRAKFSELGLRRVIATCYKNQNPDMFSKHTGDQAVCLEYDGKKETFRLLQGDGDFRKPESVDLLRRADIVVTNPPFSLFREYVAQLIAEDKRFLILGSMGAVIFKEIFRSVMAGKLWGGVSITSGDREFGVPDHYPLEAANCGIGKDGKKFVRVKGVRWFTNLDHKNRHELLDPTARYVGNESAYPKYDNYDAINVNRVADIPQDYAGVMGVPITFFDKWNPDEFELLGNSRWHDGSWTTDDINIINGRKLYLRLLIRKRRPL